MLQSSGRQRVHAVDRDELLGQRVGHAVVIGRCARYALSTSLELMRPNTFLIRSPARPNELARIPVTVVGG